MAGEGGGARLGGRKGRHFRSAPLNPLPPRALPRRCRARERGERDAQHHTRCLATACRDARTKPHSGGDTTVREAPGGDSQPPTANRHATHPNAVLRAGKEGRVIRLGPRAVRGNPPAKKPSCTHSTAPRNHRPPGRGERVAQAGRVAHGRTHSPSRDAARKTQARSPQTGSGRAGWVAGEARHTTHGAAHATGHRRGGEGEGMHFTRHLRSGGTTPSSW